jgi:ribosomal protein S18 acetylase RimI-like enzyme
MTDSPGQPITYRLREYCHPNDYPAAIQLWKTAGPGVRAGRSDTPAEVAKKLERDPDLFLVAEADGRLIGTVIGGFDGRRGLVYHLAVAADCRAAGVGSALMDELERRLRAKGCLRCYLLVTSDNQGVISYYEHRDWKPMEITILAKDIA